MDTSTIIFFIAIMALLAYIATFMKPKKRVVIFRKIYIKYEGMDLFPSIHGCLPSLDFLYSFFKNQEVTHNPAEAKTIITLTICGGDIAADSGAAADGQSIKCSVSADLIHPEGVMNLGKAVFPLASSQDDTPTIQKNFVAVKEYLKQMRVV